MWNFDVRIVENFRDVTGEVTSFSPHIILLDITLPFFNGYHWCSEIRKFSRVPIIFISSAADNMNIIMAMNLILQVAKDDERVRAVYLNGSRTNHNAPKDRFQDYDVVYVVTDTKPYYENHDWINHFGTVLYMQMPEYMDLLLEKEYTPQDTFGWLFYVMISIRLLWNITISSILI